MCECLQWLADGQSPHLTLSRRRLARTFLLPKENRCLASAAPVLLQSDADCRRVQAWIVSKLRALTGTLCASAGDPVSCQQDLDPDTRQRLLDIQDMPCVLCGRRSDPNGQTVCLCASCISLEGGARAVQRLLHDQPCTVSS